MEEQDNQELALENILKEFAPEPSAPTPPSGDTIRIDPVSQAAAPGLEGDTICFIPPVSTAPAEEPEPEQAPPAEPAPEAAEPFTPGWEPEYDAPMGDYPTEDAPTPPTRAQFRELRQKLVEGPERRYYALKEQGFGKLQLGILLCLLTTLLSMGSIAFAGLGMVSPERQRLLVYSQVLSMLVAALPGIYRLLGGITAVFHRRFTLDTALVLTFLICLGDGILGLKYLRVPFCGIFCLEMTMALWAEHQQRNTEMGQMDTLRRAGRLESVVKTENLYQEQPGFQRSTGRPEDFMDHYQEPSRQALFLNRYGLAVSGGAAVLGLGAGLLHGAGLGVHTAAAALTAALPATIFITLSRPAAVLEKRLHQLGVVLCGWSGVAGMGGNACVPLRDSDLFPAGAVKLNGVKFFGDRNPDQVVAYGTALIQTAGGSLSGVFEALLDSRNGRRYPVKNFRSYKSGGLGGEVNGDPVLVGLLPFMGSMGVEVPEGTKVNQAVYVAISGQLSGVFAISYGRNRSSAAGLATLCSYPHLTPVLVSRDFILTEGFLRGKFGINTRHIVFPDRAERLALAKRKPDPQTPALALLTKEGLAPMAFAITGARALRTAVRMGLRTHLFTGILGFSLAAILGILGSTRLLVPANLMLFQLACLIPGLLVTEWTRSL